MITIQGLSKTFNTADGKVYALRNINLQIEEGDISACQSPNDWFWIAVMSVTKAV